MRSPFKSILCGVEGNPASTEAAQQAIALAGDAAASSTSPPSTRASNSAPTTTRTRSKAASRRRPGWRPKRASRPRMQLREAKYAIDVLLPESKEHDLLVLGTHGNSRANGHPLRQHRQRGRARDRAAAADRPRGAGPEPLPEARSSLASDGSSGSWAPGPRRRPPRRRLRRRSSTSSTSTTASTRPTSRSLDAQLAEIAAGDRQHARARRPEGNATKEIVEAAKAERRLADRLRPPRAARDQVARQRQRADRQRRRVLGAAGPGRREDA